MAKDLVYSGERGPEGLAGGNGLVVRRLIADDALVRKPDAGSGTVCFPRLHPLAAAPAVRAEQADFLESIGYTSYMQDLNASDYGVAQNRDRTFILSTLGEYNYKFPVEVDLNTCIEDYFEELTDEMALKLIVKSEKAKELLVNLDEEGKLE